MRFGLAQAPGLINGGNFVDRVNNKSNEIYILFLFSR